MAPVFNAKAKAALRKTASELKALERAERKVQQQNQRFTKSVADFMFAANMVGLTREHINRLLTVSGINHSEENANG
jgi:peptide deformylase